MAKGKMMRFDPKLGAYLDDQLARFGIDATKKKMFGHETYFLNGHMYTGASELGIFVNVGEEEVRRALAQDPDTAPFSPMAGMTMKNYLLLREGAYGDPARLKGWLERSKQYLIRLGPKAPKKKAAKKAVKKAATSGAAGVRKKAAKAKKKTAKAKKKTARKKQAAKKPPARRAKKVAKKRASQKKR